MTELRYTLEFDGSICATDMDLQAALILAESLAEKFYESMRYGAKIVLYAMNHVDTEAAVE